MKRSKDNSDSDASLAKKPAPEALGSWSETSDMLFYRSEGAKVLPKLACFDMDGTLINTKSGKRYPTGPDDWVLWSQTIPVKLRALVAESPPFCVALLSNQAAIERAPGGGKPAFQRKIEAVVKALGVPAVALIATDPDGCSFYRKPCTGGLDYLASVGRKDNSKSNSKEEFFDLKASFYVGDAAGRQDGWKTGAKKDFACSDRLFAINANIAFHTPEEFFLNNSPAPFKLPDFNPNKLDPGPPTTSTILATGKELVVFVGPPASGKSSFSKKYFLASGRYDVFSRDKLGTWQKVAEATKNSLTAGRSVVVDNTNPDVESRSRYVQIAKSLKIPARCFVFDVPIEQARHLEHFRRLATKLRPPTSKADEHSHIPDMVFHSYKKNFQEPTKEEGFTEIVRVKFVAEFDDPVLEKLCRSYLLDK